MTFIACEKYDARKLDRAHVLPRASRVPASRHEPTTRTGTNLALQPEPKEGVPKAQATKGALTRVSSRSYRTHPGDAKTGSDSSARPRPFRARDAASPPVSRAVSLKATRAQALGSAVGMARRAILRSCSARRFGLALLSPVVACMVSEGAGARRRRPRRAPVAIASAPSPSHATAAVVDVFGVSALPFHPASRSRHPADAVACAGATVRDRRNHRSSMARTPRRRVASPWPHRRSKPRRMDE
jgi:hypothetical protein